MLLRPELAGTKAMQRSYSESKGRVLNWLLHGESGSSHPQHPITLKSNSPREKSIRKLWKMVLGKIQTSAEMSAL